MSKKLLTKEELGYLWELAANEADRCDDDDTLSELYNGLADKLKEMFKEAE